MDDFEYSVEISERDWECFFVECEDCNLLPPSLAGVESGMSDFDDTGSMFAKRIQKVDLTAGFSEAEHPIDDPPDCESSPVDHYLIKHGVSGMESILSGSEEDIHLQSVNMFFERLKNVTEAERDTEPSQEAAGKYREAKQKEKCCNVGQQASSSTLSKNMPKSNSLPPRDETAVGKETMEHAYTISDLNTMKKHKTCSNISSEPAASNFILKTNKSAHPEIELFIREKACAETRVNEAAQQNQSPYSTDGVVSSETTSDADTRMKVKMCTPLDVKQEDLLTSQLILSKKCSDSFSFPEMVTNVKWKEDQIPHVLQSDAMSSKKTTSLDLSPSASLKRKRRKKRRLSVETAESLHRYERPFFVKQSDSEEEHYAWRRGTGLCVSQDINLFHLNEPQKKVVSSLPTYSAISKLPVMISPKEIKVKDLSHFSCQSDGQCQYLPESTVRQGRCKASGSTEKNTTNDTSVTPRSQTDASKMSTLNNSGDVATDLQPSSKLQVEESTMLNTYTVLPLSTTEGVTRKIDLVTDTANCGRNDAHARSLQESDHLNHSIICHEEHNPEYCTAEVKSVTNSILPSTESNDMAVEVSQIDKLSAAKSVLAIKAGNSCIDNNTLCQREAELQQQLEMDCHYTDQFSSTLEKTHLPLSATGLSSCDTLDPKPKQFKTRACPLLEETSSQVDCAKLTVESSNSLPDKDCPSKGLSSLDVNITALQTEPSAVLHTLSPFDGKSELAAFPIMTCQSGNPFLSGEINLTGKSQSNTISSMSADVLTSASHLSRVSACTLDTKSVMSLLNENITDMSVSNSLSVSQNDSEGHEGKISLALAKLEEGDGTSEPKSQSISSDTSYSTCDLVVEAEVPVPASKAECEPEKPPDSKHSVFAMSSFWNEMEKLTINDILGLRMVSKATPSSFLPPLQESDEIHMFPKTDSGFCSQVESLPEQTNEESHNPNSIESSSSSVMAVNSPCSRGVMWEREPVHVNPADDIYHENTMLTSVNDISQSVLPGSVQTCPRKISKNVSVHNLPALDSGSFSRTWKGQTLQSLDKGELEKVECLTDGHMSKHDKDVDCSASSPTESYRMSLTDVFQYLFGGKQSIPSQTATDNITFCCTDGDSVPETYDHFFSEYDTESFFYPLIPAEDKAKDKLVPIFSCSRSAQRNIEYPEAYDHFFASSSDDDSSDEEEDCGPVRVVSRFNRTSSASQLYRDEYENFFTDRDVKQDFFWKNTFSFRNMNITGSTVQKQTLTNPLPLAPVRQSGRSLRRTSHPINALGNRDAMISDPLLYYLDDTFSRQLAQQPLKYEDFEKSISNPRLDAPLLPLGQSDMCLVCIAFASWVLKTANPQVGDAWKAVLLANVSALSAIRYLRKNAKKELTAAEKK